MWYIKIFFSSVIVLLYSGCKTDWEKQQPFLLPIGNELEIIFNNNNEMVTTNVFSVSGVLVQDSLASYPLQKIEGKAIQRWHKPSNQEIEDLKILFRDEPIDAEVSKNVLKSIREANCYVAYMFSYNEKAPALEKGYAHKNRNPVPGEKGYNSMLWLDMYFLDTFLNELIHISYGKF